MKKTISRLLLVGLTVFLSSCVATPSNSSIMNSSSSTSNSLVSSSPVSSTPISSTPISSTPISSTPISSTPIISNPPVSSSPSLKPEFDENDPHNLEVYFIEMNQKYGDAILIKQDKFTMLVDCGTMSNEDEKNIKEAIKTYANNEIDVLLITHPHSDHYGSIELFKSLDYKVKLIVDSGYTSTTNIDGTYQTVKKDLISKGARYCTAQESLDGNEQSPCQPYISSSYPFLKNEMSDDLRFDILDTKAYAKSKDTPIGSRDPNGVSVTGILSYQDFSMYLSGDLDEPQETILVNTNQVPPVTIMKASHHASDTSNSVPLVKKLNPQDVIISTGAASVDGTSNQHPNPVGLSYIYQVVNKDNVYSNLTMGTVVVKADKFERYSIKGLGAKRLKLPNCNPKEEKNLPLYKTHFYNDTKITFGKTSNTGKLTGLLEGTLNEYMTILEGRK